MIGVRLCLNDDVLREAKGYHVCASTMRPVKGEDSGRQLGPVDGSRDTWSEEHAIERAPASAATISAFLRQLGSLSARSVGVAAGHTRATTVLGVELHAGGLQGPNR
jgi:hypothetical protein